MDALETAVYTIGERDLILDLIEALHVGNEEVAIKECETKKTDYGMTYYNIVMECPEKRHFELTQLLGLALKIYNF